MCVSVRLCVYASLHLCICACMCVEENTGGTFEHWQAYIVEIARVPWIIGGDWNMDPRDADHRGDRSQARLVDLGTAAQKQGRNLAWIIASLRTPTWGAEGIVVVGTVYVGVQVRL